MELDERKLDEYLALIDRKIIVSGREDWACLDDAERATITAYFYTPAVSNGGLEGFFINPSGDRWRQTFAVIKLLGASRLADLFEKALTIFPGNTPSEDHLTRAAQLADAGAEGSDLLWKLDGEYDEFQIDDSLDQRLTAFAIEQLAKINCNEPKR